MRLEKERREESAMEYVLQMVENSGVVRGKMGTDAY